MRLIVAFLIVFVIVVLLTRNVYSQLYEFDCGYVSPPKGSNTLIGNPFGGISKPTRTDVSTDPYAAFPILVVFVQFKDEYYLDPRNIWPANGSPTFLGDLIATEKNTNTDTPFWEKYNPNTEMISSRWAEISRGAFHVISPSGAFSVVLPKTARDYWLDAGKLQDSCEHAINKDIWASVIAQGLTDWRPYDRWKKVGSNFVFCDLGDGDHYVDMIYKVHKSPGTFIYDDTLRSALWNKAGYNALGHYDLYSMNEIDIDHNIFIDYSNSSNGSGVTLSFNGTVDNYIASMGHEHLHLMAYTEGHVTYSNCSYGIGLEYFYSPYDMILNEYMTPTIATFGQSNSLGDYSSRNTGTGEILKVPIDGPEYFLLANRNKISKWDRVMLGDTASYEQYKDNTEYGKGLYIYHVDTLKLPYSDISPQDLECADGYWEWEFQGTGIVNLVYDCFVSGNNWKIYKKKNVLYSNDPSLIFNPNPYGDEISFHHNINNDTWPCWWGTGKQPISACFMGTDRSLVNEEDIYTKNGLMGDRYDAWKPGYNEVFSTYSSPSTLKWNNDTSGIFIYFESLSGTNANIKIYKVGNNGMTEAQILAATPPSRPMGIKHEYYYPQYGWCVPKITWNHNMEPDMVRGSKSKYKRYEVWRVTALNMSIVPNENNYTFLDTVDIPVDSLPHYEDYSVLQYDCADLDQIPPFGIKYPVRYRVKAVDNTNWASVMSDFVSTTGITPEGGIESDGGDNPVLNSNMPKEFKLTQNFPNPFNPMTKINFALPKQGFVTLKIYDIIGREIKTLVNEVKQTGYYTVDFNGSSLASGVYFYRIQSGDFISVKRMVLIK